MGVLAVKYERGRNVLQVTIMLRAMDCSIPKLYSFIYRIQKKSLMI